MTGDVNVRVNLLDASQDPMFRAITDIAPVMTWVSDASGDCIYLSRSWYAYTGQTPETGLGTGWLDAIHPSECRTAALAFSDAAPAKRPYQTEYRVRSRDGLYRWAIDSASPMIDANGVLKGYVGSIVFIDERRQAELERDRSERRLNIALLAAGLGIWEWDLDSNQFAFSPKALEIFGFPPNETHLSFERLRATIHPDDLATVQAQSEAALDPAVRAREAYRYRIHRVSDGACRWIRAHGEAVFSEDEKPRALSYVGTFEDITDEVAAQSAVAETATRLKLALDAGRLAVWELDIANDRVTHSVELNRLYGFPDDATPSADDLRSRYAPGERERLEALGREAAARGESSIRAEVRHILPGNIERWLLIQAEAAPPLGDGGPRAIGVAMDITESKQHEERLNTIARELQHRVKNSLAVVQTLVNQSFRGARSMEEAREIFTQRLMALAGTTELLTRAHGTAASLRSVVERAVRPFQDQLAQPFEMEGPDATLPSRQAVALGMALHELSTNAVKYGALSVPSGRVSITWSVVDDAIEVQWREHGGPPVVPPQSRGFGTRLLQGSLLTAAEGQVDIEFLPTGVQCRIRMRLEAA